MDWFHISQDVTQRAGLWAAQTRLKETLAINKSLSALGAVFSKLTGKVKEGAHVPYRDSKLTYLLQSSLGGNSKTLMIVNLTPTPDCVNESINSLRFAQTVHKVEIGPAHKMKAAH